MSFSRRCESRARYLLELVQGASKHLSYLLRHNYSLLGLSLDAEEFVSLDRLLSAIRKQKDWSWVTLDDILELQQTSEKKRFETVKGKIWALYGHTIPARTAQEVAVPPNILYHGTSRKKIHSILRYAILPIWRQCVHLSTYVEETKNVCLRRDENPAIFRVHAKEAWRNGVRFFKARAIFLSESIPPRFLELERSPN